MMEDASYVPKTLGKEAAAMELEDGLTEEEKLHAIGRLDEAGRTRTSDGERVVEFEPLENKPEGLARLRYGWVCQAGYYPEDLSKANQDSLLVHGPMVSQNKVWHLFAAFDGHGKYGTECSTYVTTHLVKAMQKSKDFQSDIAGSLSSGLLGVNDEMHKQKHKGRMWSSGEYFDDSMSGTTAICVLLNESEIVVGNVGDSRAILASEDQQGKLVVSPLSIDQTPFRKDERDRCKAAGAVVMTIDQLEGYRPYDPNSDDWGNEEEDGGDPPRLWFANKGVPGVAFTRSVGDELAETIGCIAEAEILKQKIEPNDRFIVIASDGVFEFLSSETVVEMVSKFKDPSEAAKALVAEAYKLWLHYEVRTDDITAIVIFLQHSRNTDEQINPEKKQKIVPKDKEISGTFVSLESMWLLERQSKPVRRQMSRQKVEEIERTKYPMKRDLSRVSENENEIGDDEEEEEEELEPIDMSSIPPKSAEEIEQIKSAVEANFLFQHLAPNEVQQILDAFVKVEVDPNTMIIQQGERGDRFYVVGTGVYDCFVRPYNQEDSKTGLGTLVMTYEATTSGLGNPSFGELALMYRRPRAASVVSKTKGILWALDRATFRKVLIRRPNAKTIKTLKSVEIFKTLGRSQLNRLADIVSEKTFEDNQVIIRQGEVGDSMYIIKSGHVRCTVNRELRRSVSSGRNIVASMAEQNIEHEGRVPKPPTEGNDSSLRRFSSFSRAGALSSQISFDPHTAEEVMRIGPGGYFGERALVKAEPRAASVIAIGGQTKCLCISRSGFEAILGPLVELIATHSHKRQARALGNIRRKLIRESLFGISPESTIRLEDFVPLVEIHHTIDDSLAYVVVRFKSDRPYKNEDVKFTIKEYRRGIVEAKKRNSRVRKDSLLLLIAALSDNQFKLDSNELDHQSEVEKEPDHGAHKEDALQPKSDPNEKTFPFVPNIVETVIGENTVNMVLATSICGNLDEFVSQGVDEKTAAFVCACVAIALPSLHAKQVLCRGIAPCTLMLDDMGYVRIVDMSNGKFLEDENDRTYTLCGFEPYMAPEQILNKGHGFEVDYWSLGVLAYEMICGNLPFSEPLEQQGGTDTDPGMSSPSSTQSSHSTSRPPMFREILKFNASKAALSSLSAHAASFVKLLLERNPRKRSENIGNILEHPFLKLVDVEQVRTGQYPSPLQDAARETFAKLMQEASSRNLDADFQGDIPKDEWYAQF